MTQNSRKTTVRARLCQIFGEPCYRDKSPRTRYGGHTVGGANGERRGKIGVTGGVSIPTEYLVDWLGLGDVETIYTASGTLWFKSESDYWVRTGSPEIAINYTCVTGNSPAHHVTPAQPKNFGSWMGSVVYVRQLASVKLCYVGHVEMDTSGFLYRPPLWGDVIIFVTETLSLRHLLFFSRIGTAP